MTRCRASPASARRQRRSSASPAASAAAACWSGRCHRSLNDAASARGAGAEQRERDRHQPAAAECERGERHEQQQEPRAAIAPARALRRRSAFAVASADSPSRPCVRRAAHRCRALRALTSHSGRRRLRRPRQGSRRRASAHDDIAAVVLEEIALRERTGAPAVLPMPSTETSEAAAWALRRRLRSRSVRAPSASTMMSPRCSAGLLDQLLRLGRSRGRVIAGDGHRRGIERVDEIAHRADVVGQRRGDVRLAGIADQRGLVILAAFEDVDELVARALEAARLLVLRHHRRGELEREHARGLVAVERHRLALPRGAGERERRRASRARSRARCRRGRNRRRCARSDAAADADRSRHATRRRRHGRDDAAARTAAARAATAASSGRRKWNSANVADHALALVAARVEAPRQANACASPARERKRRRAERGGERHPVELVDRTQALLRVGDGLELVDRAIDCRRARRCCARGSSGRRSPRPSASACASSRSADGLTMRLPNRLLTRSASAPTPIV